MSEEKYLKIVSELQADELGLTEFVKSKFQLEDDLATLKMEVEMRSKLKQTIDKSGGGDNQQQQQSSSSSATGGKSPVIEGSGGSIDCATLEGVIQVIERNLEQRSYISELRAKLQVSKAQVNSLASVRQGSSLPQVDVHLSTSVIEMSKVFEDRIEALKEIISRRDTAIEAFQRRLLQMHNRSTDTNRGDALAIRIELLESEIQGLNVKIIAGKERESHQADILRKLQSNYDEGQVLILELKQSISRMRVSFQSTELLNDAQAKYKQLENENLNLIGQINDINAKQVILLTQNTQRVREEEKVKLVEMEQRFRRQIQEINESTTSHLDNIKEELAKDNVELNQQIEQKDKECQKLATKIEETISDYTQQLKQQKYESDMEMDRRVCEIRAEMEQERKDRQKEGYIVMDENKKFREQIKQKSVQDAREEVREEINQYRQAISSWEDKYAAMTQKLEAQHKHQITIIIAEQHRQTKEQGITHHQQQILLTEKLYRIEQEKDEMIRKIAMFELHDFNARPFSTKSPNSPGAARLSNGEESIELAKMQARNDILLAAINDLNDKAELAGQKHLEEVRQLCEEVMAVKGKVQQWYQEQLDFAISQQADFVRKMKEEMESMQVTHEEIVRRLKEEIQEMCAIVDERPSKKTDLLRIAALEEQHRSGQVEITRLRREHKNTLKNFDVFNPGPVSTTTKSTRTIHSLVSNLTFTAAAAASSSSATAAPTLAVPNHNMHETNNNNNNHLQSNQFASASQTFPKPQHHSTVPMFSTPKDRKPSRSQLQSQSTEQPLASLETNNNNTNNNNNNCSPSKMISQTLSGVAGGAFARKVRKMSKQQRCKTAQDENPLSQSLQFSERSFGSPIRPSTGRRMPLHPQSQFQSISHPNRKSNKAISSVEAELKALLEPSTFLKDTFLERGASKPKQSQSNTYLLGGGVPSKNKHHTSQQQQHYETSLFEQQQQADITPRASQIIKPIDRINTPMSETNRTNKLIPLRTTGSKEPIKVQSASTNRLRTRSSKGFCNE